MTRRLYERKEIHGKQLVAAGSGCIGCADGWEIAESGAGHERIKNDE